MRTTIWLVSVALLGGAACKKTSTEKAATEVRKAQENLDDQKKDLNKQSKDMVDETKDVAKEGKDVTKEANDVNDAERRLATARTSLDGAVKARIAEIDGKLAALESHTDPLSKRLAVDLRAKRDTVASRSAAADSIAITNWDAFQKEIEDNLNSVSKDLDKAVTDDKDRDKILDHKLKLDTPIDRTDRTEPMTR